MVHTMQFFSGVYFTDPTEVLNLGESASLGTGIMISTLLAVDRLLNWDLALTMYSTRLCACLSITDSIQINGFTWGLYFMSAFLLQLFCSFLWQCPITKRQKHPQVKNINQYEEKFWVQSNLKAEYYHNHLTMEKNLHVCSAGMTWVQTPHQGE